MIRLLKIQDLNYMNLKGTKFQIKVWNYLKKIPKGETRTYLQVAKAIGKPKAHRAVANAVGNPDVFRSSTQSLKQGLQHEFLA